MTMEICMEEGCSELCHAWKCRAEHGDQYHRPTVRGNGEIRHLLCLTRLQTGILLLMFTALFTFLYLHHRQTSQYVSAFGNQSGTSAQKKQQQEAMKPVAFLTASDLQKCKDDQGKAPTRSPSADPERSKAPTRSPSADPELLKWEDGVGNVLINAFQLDRQTNLIVSTAGYYYIYLQVTYDCDECDLGKPILSLTTWVNVYAMEYTKDITLLTSSDTLDCNTAKKKSLYTGGVFELKRGARLKAWSKNHQDQNKLIKRSESEVFFGAHLLS